jgi:hypothetical protein
LHAAQVRNNRRECRDALQPPPATKRDHRSGAMPLFQLRTHGYEQAPTVLTSDKGYGEIFGDDVMVRCTDRSALSSIATCAIRDI